MHYHFTAYEQYTRMTMVCGLGEKHHARRKEPWSGDYGEAIVILTDSEESPFQLRN
jgi:hypothetical protein